MVCLHLNSCWGLISPCSSIQRRALVGGVMGHGGKALLSGLQGQLAVLPPFPAPVNPHTSPLPLYVCV